MATFRALPQALGIQLDSVTVGGLKQVTAPTVMLMADGHDFDTSPNHVIDVVADEVAPTNYARQPLAFAGPITLDSDGRAVITWVDSSFGLLGGGVDATISGCYILDNTGDDTTSRLLYSVPFDEAATTDGTAYVVRWASPTAKTAP